MDGAQYSDVVLMNIVVTVHITHYFLGAVSESEKKGCLKQCTNSKFGFQINTNAQSIFASKLRIQLYPNGR